MAAIPSAPMPTVDAIYASYEQAQESGYRDHLGASLIGRPCERALWYSHRWATRARHTGRLLRLFQTGHMEEARFVSDLRAAGVTVLEVNEATGKQFSVRDEETGHFGGSFDGVGVGFPEAPKTWHLCEFKTHSEKSFKKLQSEGVEKSKPDHMAQMQVYMHLGGLTRAFYMAKNKNTDELYQERIEYDPVAGARLLAKAHRIIAAKEPSARISSDPSWFECKFCAHHEQCWGDTVPELHCRSCLFSTPTDGGAWHCGKHDKQLTRAEQEAGCLEHLYIPSLVPGTQSDSGDDWVEYIMRDGFTWRNQGIPF